MYKNYFLGKTSGHQSIASIQNALEALQLLKDQAFLVSDGEGYLLADTKIIDTLNFRV